MPGDDPGAGQTPGRQPERELRELLCLGPGVFREELQGHSEERVSGGESWIIFVEEYYWKEVLGHEVALCED